MGGETNHATSASASVKMPASDRIAHILEMSDDLHDMDFMNVKPSNPSTRNYSFYRPVVKFGSCEVDQHPDR